MPPVLDKKPELRAIFVGAASSKSYRAEQLSPSRVGHLNAYRLATLDFTGSEISDY